MMMPGRKFSFGNSYRYGFNGKENDNEVKGEGNQQDYGMRVYDPRLGRFLSIDPLRKKYPFYTPYQFAGNKPTQYIDIDGGEPPEEEPAPETWREEGYENEEAWEAARGAAGRRLREEEKEKEEKENEARGKREPAIRRFYENLKTWGRNSFDVAPSVFGESPTTIYRRISINRGNGNAWEKAVGEVLSSNPNYQDVAKQVTLVVTGTMKNGTILTARIRVDFVGIKDNGLTLDLYEAKYSIEEITMNNVKQTLTKEQGKLNIITQFDNTLSIFVRGDKLKAFGLPSGTDILTHIKSAQIVVPAGTTKPAANPGIAKPAPAKSNIKRNSKT